jgi:hypothetical protein
MHRFLLTSAVRTLNPDEADWFYTPVYTTCDLTPWGHPLTTKSPRMMRSAIQYISKRWPYWNRTEGADHFFVTPHDFGACFYFQVSHRAINHELDEYQCNVECKVIKWNSSLVISPYIHSICSCSTIHLLCTQNSYCPGRDGHPARCPSGAAPCYTGPDFWAEASCVPEGRLHHHPAVCSSS